MTTQFFVSDSIGTGIRMDLATTDSGYIAAGVNVLSSNYYAVQISGTGQRLDVLGSVFGYYGINISTAATPSNIAIAVQAGGTVAGSYDAIYSVSVNNVSILNAGTISGGHEGIVLGGDSVRILNSGLIESSGSGFYDAAVELFSMNNAAGTEAELINTGTIRGVGTAIYGDANFNDRVLNYGTIIGRVYQAAGDDLLLNRGTIIGDVDLSNGADILRNIGGGVIDGAVDLGTDGDLYDGRSGEVNGTVLGGAGDDSFIGNAALSDTFDGGDDIDTLDFRYGGAVTVALDASFDNSGAALGDTYTNFERVTGSTADDLIRGNALANVLTGLAGADALEGMAGNDLLYGGGGEDRLDGGANTDQLSGGLGIDTLTGGLGDDTFRFASLRDVGDVITDFGATAGNNDRFMIVAASFGGGLVAGALAASAFQSRADNVAQDADDRFVFRTSDRTLWFDADGNGAAAAILVADLQAGTAVTAADILLV